MKFVKLVFPVLLAIGIISLFVFNKSSNNSKEYIVLPDTLHFKLDKKKLLKSKELDKYFSRKNKITGFNGTVLFAENGEIVYEKAFGYSNLKTKAKNNLKTRFQLASVSKPFTSYAIMLLKQEGELSYEDTVQKFFPEFPYKGITIKLLMIHKSGLPEYFYFADKLWEDKKTPITNLDVIDLLIKDHPQIIVYLLPSLKK